MTVALTTDAHAVLPLENSDHLTRDEFERRYNAMPDIKKAELLEGVVYMPSPVTFEQNGEQHASVMAWQGTYRAYTPGVRLGDNSTIRLDLDNEPQPDGLLLIDPAHGGRTTFTAGYVTGGPELVVEVSSSNASLDNNLKVRIYRRKGMQQCLNWRVRDQALDWFALNGTHYKPLPLTADGTIRSVVFPGLWLTPVALFDGHLTKVLAVLQQGLASPEHAAFVAALKRR